MNYGELTRLLQEAGWRFERNGKGSHRVWTHPDRPGRIIVPDHGSKEIRPGLVRGIKRQAGIK